MSQNSDFRSRLRAKIASRKLRNKQLGRKGRNLLLESLEPRSLMAGDLAATVDLASFRYTPTTYTEMRTTGLLSSPSSADPLRVAQDYLLANAAKYGLTSDDVQHFVVKNSYQDAGSGTTHIYLRQTYNGLEIGNTALSIHVTSKGEVINVSSSFVGNLQYPSSEQSLSPGVTGIEAFRKFTQQLGHTTLPSSPSVVSQPSGRNQRMSFSGGGITSGNVAAELQYVATPTGLQLGWKVNFKTANQGNWFDALLSAKDGTAVSVADWVNNASYTVYPLPNESPAEGARVTVVDPANPVASPYGWHDVNGVAGPEFTDTRGNNIFAQEDRLGVGSSLANLGNGLPTTRPSGGTALDFNFPIDLNQPPSGYTNASTVNLFYLTNVAHDVTFMYGFDEVSGNFQSMNYTQQGKGGDPVMAYAQAGAAPATGQPTLNNAFMATPPDGFSPTIAMFEWDTDFTGPLPALYSPRRDGSLDSGIVMHEYFHGVSNRLTGGPANAAALQNTQSNSMGEGWSDFFALWMTQSPTDTKLTQRPVGNYVGGPLASNPTKGLRRFQYSYDTSVNPLTFVDFNGGGGANCATATSNCESHNAGEIWAQTLWDMHWNLVEKYGYDSNIYSGKGGNNVSMQLVIDGLKLQPANPTFTQARDAILQADLIRNKGVNQKEIWAAFARRGLGFSADSDINNGLTVFGFSVDDSRSIELQAAFDMPRTVNQIRGTVFLDANGNGLRDTGEGGTANATVYLDLNSNNAKDPLEPSTTSDASGNYQFDLYVPGSFTVTIVPGTGFQVTTPVGGTATVTLVAGQTASDINFGLRSGSPLSTGIVFNDLDGDGRRDEDEPGLAGVYVYADYDGDKRMDLGEPQTVTNADGNYSLKLDRQGTYFVRQVVPAGYTQTYPTRGDGFPVTISSGSLNANFEFGDTVSEDWGDAPDTYKTLSASGGAVHGYLPGFFLGTSVDLESDGVPSTGATGDDATPTDVDDENGVQFNSKLFPGSTTNIVVTVNLKDRKTETVNGKTKTTILQDNSAGRLYGWVDFNRDGDFDTNEQIFNDLLLLEGTHNLSFAVPRSAVSGVTYARFRYGYEHNLGPTGRSIAGEVEDYQVRILTDTPDAVDDVFSVNQNSTANQLAVLDNDIASSNGDLVINSVSTSTKGTVVISPDGKSLRYTPKSGQIGSDTFTYTVRDPAGATDTARVSVTILASITAPIAVDDSTDVFAGSSNNIISVLSNDLAGIHGPIGIVAFDSGSSGTVVLDNRNTTDPTDDVLRYTPNADFSGTDRFQYTVEDAVGQQSTARVTVHVKPGDLNDDIVEYRLEVTDINNNVIQAIGVGETFKIRAYVEDLRSDDTVDDGIDRRGVGAAYLDVLYSYNLLSLSGAPVFSGLYTNATSGNTTIPGLINEVGALQTGATPVGAGEKLLFEFTAVATGVGTATFVGDPADQITGNGGSPDHDTVLFEPPSNAVTVPQIRFTNTSLQIVGTGGRPSATDNTFTVPANVVDTPLNVLANDVDVNNPPLTISAVGTATGTSFTTANGSRVTVSTDGKLLLYTPRNGFNGTEQFSYTARNAVGLTASATVTVQVGTPTKELSVRLVATDLQGNVLTGPVTVGDDFQVRVYVQDTRTNPPDRNRMGVFSAYLDMLYDGGLVSTIGDLTADFGFRMSFGPEYNANGRSASNALPNLINELGAFQTSFGPLGPNEQLLAAVTFNADRAGTANFVSDPADASPQHDILFFEPDDAAVSLSRVSFRTTSVTIVSATAGGEYFQNKDKPADVNADGFVAPMDALLVINQLNRMGSGEAEASTAASGKLYLDVNGDGYVSPMDALQVINDLQRTHGEGEFVLIFAESDQQTLAPQATSDSAANNLVVLAAATMQGTAVDAEVASHNLDDAPCSYERLVDEALLDIGLDNPLDI